MHQMQITFGNEVTLNNPNSTNFFVTPFIKNIKFRNSGMSLPYVVLTPQLQYVLTSTIIND